MTILKQVLLQAVPTLALLGIAAAMLLTSQKQEAKRASALFAITLTALTAAGSLWTLHIIDRLQQRDSHDFVYEGIFISLALIGGISALIWLSRSRKLPAFITLAASIWSGLIWIYISTLYP